MIRALGKIAPSRRVERVRLMINNYFARGASATALMLALATMPANAQEALPAIDVGVAQPGDAPADAPPPAATARK